MPVQRNSLEFKFRKRYFRSSEVYVYASLKTLFLNIIFLYSPFHIKVVCFVLFVLNIIRRVIIDCKLQYYELIR